MKNFTHIGEKVPKREGLLPLLLLNKEERDKIGKEYPEAIVNHKKSRDYVMDKFKQF